MTPTQQDAKWTKVVRQEHQRLLVDKDVILKALPASRSGTLNSGVDPELMIAVAELGALSIAEGTVNFAVWVRDVIATTRTVGIADEDVKPFLKEAYAAISGNPDKYGVTDEQADEMNTPREIRGADIDALVAKADAADAEQENTTDDADTADAKWASEIQQEHQRLLEDEDAIHNRDLHRRILATWERDSPLMWARLQKLNLTEVLAYVLQERMWLQAKEYRLGGMPVTDAREQAEIEHLLLEPELPEQDGSDLPDDLQDAPQNLKDRWREAMRRMEEDD
jgi:predicted DCC family thiol-disulfide oxidoreductase YuxK